MMRLLVLIVLALGLAACGRPLTQQERAFLQTMHGDDLNMDRMRLHNGAPTRAVTCTV